MSRRRFREFPLRRAEQLDSMGGSRRALCAWDSLSAAPFAGTGALPRSTNVDTGAHASDSAPSYARREPRQSRSEARILCLARSSCAVAPSRQAAQGHPVHTGRDSRGGLLSVTFLGRARKVTSRRAAPGLLKRSVPDFFTMTPCSSPPSRRRRECKELPRRSGVASRPPRVRVLRRQRRL